MSPRPVTMGELLVAADLTPYIIKDGTVEDMRPLYPGHRYTPERWELLDRLNRRWVDGIDPGLPARMERLLR